MMVCAESQDRILQDERTSEERLYGERSSAVIVFQVIGATAPQMSVTPPETPKPQPTHPMTTSPE